MEITYVSLGYTLLLFAAVLLLMYISKRSYGVLKLNKDIKIISAQPLNTKDKLLLVEVKGQTLLLGVTSNQISHLITLDNTEVVNTSTSEVSAHVQV